MRFKWHGKQENMETSMFLQHPSLLLSCEFAGIDDDFLLLFFLNVIISLTSLNYFPGVSWQFGGTGCYTC